MHENGTNLKLLFHCCCAPCTLACIDQLPARDLSLFWYNPNIHPFTEYLSRLKTLEAFAAANGLPLETAGGYGLKPFLIAVFPEMENTSVRRRCEICYRLRLEKCAQFAAEKGFAAISTSLLASPYQDHDAIRRAGEDAAAKYGVDFYYRDFRGGFRESQARARSIGYYMQKYCGCIFSEEERYAKKPEKREQS
ncbi:MAG: epoxyqueuosine reductase QueH [Treponema sp.]|nr:epoxyqueuosine reductase QueH [Treponema sp.]